MKYLLNMRVCERITSLKCLTWWDFFNFDRRSLRIIYEVRRIFVDYNYSIQSNIILDIFEMNLFLKCQSMIEKKSCIIIFKRFYLIVLDVDWY
jgi:hypothetical protein